MPYIDGCGALVDRDIVNIRVQRCIEKHIIHTLPRDKSFQICSIHNIPDDPGFVAEGDTFQVIKQKTASAVFC